MLNVVDFVKKVLIGLIVLVALGAAMLAGGTVVVKILMFLGADLLFTASLIGLIVAFCWIMGDIVVGTRKKEGDK